MSIDGSDAHPIYRPEPEREGVLDAEARAALVRDHRDWTGAGHLPDVWIVALSELSPGATYGIWLDGVWVAFTVAATTADPAVMRTALRQLRHVVADTPTAQPEVPVIDRRLPRQIGSARWRTPCGDVTVLQPGQARHRKPTRRRFTAFGAPLAAVWALLHGLRSSATPLWAAAGIAAVAIVPAVPAPAATPVPPVPGQTREEFVPARNAPAAAAGPSVRPTRPRPLRARMSAAAPSSATATPDPADSQRQIPAPTALPVATTEPPTSSPAPATSASPPPSLKASPAGRKVIKHVTRRVCVAVQVQLLHKPKAACKKR